MKHYFPGRQFAEEHDLKDPLRGFREQFFIPKQANGEDVCYFAGNSLGLQPKKTPEYVIEELDKWKHHGVHGHVHQKKPWVSYHEEVSTLLASLVGGLPSEVVAMNSLSVNLHLMLVSFYRPTASKYKILINPHLFSSDYYALCSQVKFHGFNPDEAIIVLPASADGIVASETIHEVLAKEGDAIALVLMEAVDYFTGQAFDIGEITALAHHYECVMGVDLAHGVGNCEFALHQWQTDFAVWCSYKYLNGGPGCVGGCFVHENHHDKKDIPRFLGWWGQDKATRFKMEKQFKAILGAEGWQLSNPPILTLACLRASLEIFEQATLKQLRLKSKQLTGYLEFMMDQLNSSNFKQITPKDPLQRGCQLSFKVETGAPLMLQQLQDAGFICDLRHPNIIRIAPTPLYNCFLDIYKLSRYARDL